MPFFFVTLFNSNCNKSEKCIIFILIIFKLDLDNLKLLVLIYSNLFLIGDWGYRVTALDK